MKATYHTLLKHSSKAILIFGLFLAALGIRLFQLTNPPNDFYMVRQYRSLLIARGMYYAQLPTAPQWQRDFAIAQWKGEGLIEPPLMESLAALTYHVIGEHIWVGRVYATLFWLAGGLAILLLAKELSMLEGGIIALAYFLFLPFGVIASRAFMPDSLMTAFIAWSMWALYRWEKQHSWKYAILAGILTGIAILIKSVAVFPLLGAAAGLVISRRSVKRILADRQTWAVAGITTIPTVLFYIYGMFIVGTLQSQFGFRFFPVLLKDPSFYGRWLFIATGIVGFAALFISLAGVLLFRFHGLRNMVAGAWLGYIIYGFIFPYHFITHEYYHLPLIPIVAIGLIPVADLLVQQISIQKSILVRALLTCLFLFGVAMKIWESRITLVKDDYRNEISYWKELGKQIGYDENIVELSGDYGYRLAYFGWVTGSIWSTSADDALRALAGQSQSDFATIFANMTSGKDLFVVTNPSEWKNQPELREYLTANYPLIAENQSDGYWIFDLKP